MVSIIKYTNNTHISAHLFSTLSYFFSLYNIIVFNGVCCNSITIFLLERTRGRFRSSRTFVRIQDTDIGDVYQVEVVCRQSLASNAFFLSGENSLLYQKWKRGCWDTVVFKVPMQIVERVSYHLSKGCFLLSVGTCHEQIWRHLGLFSLEMMRLLNDTEVNIQIKILPVGWITFHTPYLLK